MYRTKTYIAGDWTENKTEINQLYKWNESDYWGLSFHDAHEYKQARDESLNCSIKKSLKERMDISKTFVLIVGNDTKNLRAGSCPYCNSYNSWTKSCARGYYMDNRSFIEYECDKAVEAGIKIVVLYASTVTNRDKCPDNVKYKGTHIPMYYYQNNQYFWNYNEIKNTIMGN